MTDTERPSELGYFGPGSVTWRIHAEPVAMVGGLRALLLQALHPQAMQLLAERSNFRADPWARFERTVGYVATVCFAPTEEVDAAAARVRAVHAALGVTDAEQLAWVHACLVESFLIAARGAGIRLGPADVDRYVAEQARAAELVEVPAELVPHSAAELARFMTEIRPRLAGTAAAREAARLVVAPPLPVPRRFALPARLGWTTISTLAVGLLPGWARAMYRLPPLPGASLTTAAGLRALRRTVRTLPEQYREGPMYRAAKARAAVLGAGSDAAADARTR
jgi:uncharacterized protein (DUF2236 family)